MFPLSFHSPSHSLEVCGSCSLIVFSFMMCTGGDPDCQQTASHLLSTWIRENAYIQWFWYLKSLMKSEVWTSENQSFFISCSWWHSGDLRFVARSSWSFGLAIQRPQVWKQPVRFWSCPDPCPKSCKKKGHPTVSSTATCFLQFSLLKICCQNGTLLHRCWKCVEDLDPQWTSDTSAKWDYLIFVILGIVWRGHVIDRWQGFPMPTGCHFTQKLSDQPVNGGPDPWCAISQSAKISSAGIFFCFFSSYGPMWSMSVNLPAKKYHVWSQEDAPVGFPASSFTPGFVIWRVDFGGSESETFLAEKNSRWLLCFWKIGEYASSIHFVTESFSLKNECGGPESVLNLGFHIQLKDNFSTCVVYPNAWATWANQRHAFYKTLT